MVLIVIIGVVLISLIKIVGNTRKTAQAARIQAGLELPPPPPLPIGETIIRLGYLLAIVAAVILFVHVAS